MTICRLWIVGWVLVPHRGTDLPPSELGVPCCDPFGGLNQPGGVHRSPVRIRTRRGCVWLMGTCSTGSGSTQRFSGSEQDLAGSIRVLQVWDGYVQYPHHPKHCDQA